MRHHLAILYATFLEDITAGRKTVECRFGKIGYPPHGLTEPGDLIWLKETSGPVRAIATARSVRCFQHLTPRMIDLLRREWNPEIRAPEAFWQSHRHATAATLIWLGHVCPLRPFWIEKSDRRAWVLLEGPPVPGQPVIAGWEPAATCPPGAEP